MCRMQKHKCEYNKHLPSSDNSWVHRCCFVHPTIQLTSDNTATSFDMVSNWVQFQRESGNATTEFSNFGSRTYCVMLHPWSKCIWRCIQTTHIVLSATLHTPDPQGVCLFGIQQQHFHCGCLNNSSLLASPPQSHNQHGTAMAVASITHATQLSWPSTSAAATVLQFVSKPSHDNPSSPAMSTITSMFETQYISQEASKLILTKESPTMIQFAATTSNRVFTSVIPNHIHTTIAIIY